MAQKVKSLFITGTDTGVGKTVITAALAGLLGQRGYKVGLMKPVQTGCRRQKNKLIATDLEFSHQVLLSVSPQAQPPVSYEGAPNVVYCFEPPVSPNLAAQLAGKVIEPKEIIKSYRQLSPGSDIVLIEGIGGLMVPLNDNYLVRDLMADMQAPVIIVARPGLGTINHTLLTLEVARKSGAKIMGVVINGLRKKEAGLSEQHNPDIIARFGKVKILGILPFIPDLDVERGRPNRLVKVAARHLAHTEIYTL